MMENGRGRKHSGTILISVLWILVILTVLMVSLGRNARVELALVKHAVSKIKSRYLAWAGFVYARERIRQDSLNDESKSQDTLYQCGVYLGQNESAEDAFKNRTLDDGYFEVRYTLKGEMDAPKFFYGIQDEERRINLNALSLQNYNVLSALISGFGFDEIAAKTIACAVLDWKDEDDVVADVMCGAENDYYRTQGTPYQCKNRLFDSPEELLLVRGMTQNIYEAIKDYVTVFPRQGVLQLNFDTASGTALTALARAMLPVVPSASTADAQALIEKMLQYRRGEDGVPFTSDDRRLELNAMPLNAQERDLFLVMSQFRTYTSDYLRVRVEGVEKAWKAKTVIEAVVARDKLTTLQWHRN